VEPFAQEDEDKAPVLGLVAADLLEPERGLIKGQAFLQIEDVRLLWAKVNFIVISSFLSQVLFLPFLGHGPELVVGNARRGPHRRGRSVRGRRREGRGAVLGAAAPAIGQPAATVALFDETGLAAAEFPLLGRVQHVVETPAMTFPSFQASSTKKSQA